MSGGVDSSVAAALLLEDGHDVVGVTLKLWGGAVRHRVLLGGRRRRRPPGGRSSSASTTTCSTSATTSTPAWSAPTSPPTPPGARPTRASSATGTSSSTACCAGPTPSASTPSPPATTPASAATAAAGGCAGAPTGPRTSATCSTCSARTSCAGVLLPVGDLTKAEVRARAAALGLRTAAKPDSQDVCFITGRPAAGAASSPTACRSPRAGWSTPAARWSGRSPRSSWSRSASAGASAWPAAGRPATRSTSTCRAATVTVGGRRRPPRRRRRASPRCSWVDGEPAGPVEAQCSAHGEARPAAVGPGRRDRALRRAPAPGGPGPERRALPRRRGPRRRPRRLTPTFWYSGDRIGAVSSPKNGRVSSARGGGARPRPGPRRGGWG